MSLIKDPDSTLDYVVDWTPWLATGDTITAVTVLAPAGITLNPTPHTTTFTATAVTFWLTGGVDGTDYEVTCRVTTTGGRTDDYGQTIKVRNKYAPTVTPAPTPTPGTGLDGGTL